MVATDSYLVGGVGMVGGGDTSLSLRWWLKGGIMCYCGKPVVNGELGFRYDFTGGTAVYPVNPPEFTEDEILVYDEPGRCGGLDSHSHHYRIVRSHGSLCLLVKHGGGQERIRLSCAQTLTA